MSVQTRYKVLKKIGEGAQGSIHLVLDTKTSQNYARKRISCENMNELNVALQEVTSMLKLNHPGIVSTHNFFISQEKSTSLNMDCMASSEGSAGGGGGENFIPESKFVLMIICEYCTADNLMTFINRHRRKKRVMPLRIVLAFTKQLLSALACVHSHGIVHRDLKPSNVFLDREVEIDEGEDSEKKSGGEKKRLIVKIGDFGFSKFLSSEEFTHTLLGSRLYLPPEIQKQEKYTNKIDIWGIYAILLDMLASKTFDFAYELRIDKKKTLAEICQRYSEDCRDDLLQFLMQLIEIEQARRPEIPKLIDMVTALQRKIGVDVDAGEDGVQSEEGLEKKEMEMEAGGMLGSRKSDSTEDGGEEVMDEKKAVRMLLEKEEQIYFLQHDLQQLHKKFQVFKKKKRRLFGWAGKPNYVFGSKEIEIDDSYPVVRGQVFVIYSGKFKKTGVDVVLKKMHLKVKDLKTLKRKLYFFDEIITEISSPQIEKVHGFFLYKKDYYVVTEYLKEGDLFKYLQEVNELSIFTKIQYCLDIMNAVYYLFNLGYTHVGLNSKSLMLCNSKRNLKVVGNYFLRKIESRDEFDFSSFKKKILKNLYHCFSEIFLVKPFHPLNDEKGLEKHMPLNHVERDFIEIITLCATENVPLKNLLFKFGKLKEHALIYEKEMNYKLANSLSYHSILNILEFHRFEFNEKSDVAELYGWFSNDRFRKVFMMFKSVHVTNLVKDVPFIRNVQSISMGSWQKITPEWLKFTYNRVTSIEFFQASPELLGCVNKEILKVLKIETAVMEDGITSEINQFKSLQNLYLVRNEDDPIDNEKATLDICIPSLTKLELYQTCPRCFTFQQLPRIKYLYVHYSDLDNFQLQNIAKLTTVVDLRLKYCKFLGDNFLQLFQNPNFEMINLYRTHLNFEALENVVVPPNTKLHYLEFFLFNFVPTEFVRRMMKVKSLKVLKMPQCHLQNEIVELLVKDDNDWGEITIDLTKNWKVKKDTVALLRRTRRNITILPKTLGRPVQ